MLQPGSLLYRFGRFLLLAQLFLAPSAAVLAQEVHLLEPAQELQFAEAPDFASTELGNAWDFTQRRDIGFEVGFQGASVGTSGGIWSAVSADFGAYVFPLFGGYSGSLFAEAPTGDTSLPRFGVNHPIPSQRYYYLSMRSRSSSPSSLALYWNSTPEPELFPDGSQGGASFDGQYFAGAQRSNGFNLRSFDLRGGGFEQQFGQWSGSVVALRIDPSVGAAPGTQTDIDWIRLVDPLSAPAIPIRWSMEKIPPGSMVRVCMDDIPYAFNCTPMAHYIYGQAGRPQAGPWYSSHPSLSRDSGVLQYPSAALPPGQYYFYIEVFAAAGAQTVLLARSAYSAAVRITAAPEAYFSAPSKLSGSDYASTERADAWDMSQLSDVRNSQVGSFPQALRQFSNAASVQGLFQATADAPLPGNAESDAQLHMDIPANKQIEAKRYRYLSYSIGADPSLYPSIEDKVRHGWVTRPIFYNGDLFVRGGSFKAHVLYEGMHTYTIDLWDASQLEHGLSWLDVGTISHLRIDPLETPWPTWFFVDSVSLHTENMPIQGTYTIRWHMADTDSTHLTYSLYLDEDDQHADGILIHTQSGARPGEHSFELQTKQLAAGRYYPYLKINDGFSERLVYAPVPIVVGSGLAKSRPRAPYDYDGDGFSDPAVYRPAAIGTFFVKQSLLPWFQRNWGLAGYQAIEGDFDGDKKTDIAVVTQLGGMLHWFVIRSSDGGLYYRVWGFRGDSIAVADYDGDKRDEIAVYRQGAWYILDENGHASVQHWGEAADKAIPADYDGDGIEDAAIWRPRDGTWWIRRAQTPAGESPYIVRQWGLPGDIPLTADLDGDAKSDFVVWRPANGTWYVRYSSNNSYEQRQWGLPGDVPVLGNFTSLSTKDFSVWRPGTGQWFHLSRKGSYLIDQWGLPGDSIVRRNVLELH